MLFPKINFDDGNRDMIDTFKGYHHGDKIAENEFYDMSNMSSDKYPLISPRPYRVAASTIALENVTGAVVRDGALWYTEGPYIVRSKGDHNDPISYDLGLSNETKKQLVAMGAYIIIFPDKKYINTIDTNDRGDLEATYTNRNASASFYVCDKEGVEYTSVYVINGKPSGEEPEESESVDSQVAIDVSSTPFSLYQYNPETKGWFPVDGYMLISQKGIGANFSAGDFVHISNIRSVEDSFYRGNLEMLEGNNKIVKAGADFIVIKNLSKKGEASDITIERKVPQMQYVIESGNRLWGCMSGINENGEYINEIYASALGNFKNWYAFEGISTDSFSASVGTDGSFTGAITYRGYPLFFKENCVHRVYGTMPSNYQLQTTPCEGVQNGSSKSLTIVNNILYYLSINGIYAYDGSNPISVSDIAFGDSGTFLYRNGIAGTFRGKYYISMQDENDISHLFVYDTKRGLWHKEDNAKIIDFATVRDSLYFFLDDGEWLWLMAYNADGASEKPFKWHIETGIIGTDSPFQKYISRIDIRMSLDVGSIVMFSIEYDSSGTWEYLYHMMGTSTDSFGVPIRPRRCDHFRLKIEGTGEARIFSISKITRQGSTI